MAIREIEFQGQLFSISYELLNRDKKRDALFLHGWGSSKELMKSSFQNSFKEYRHIYLDLVGFGESGDAPIPMNSHIYFEVISRFLDDIGASIDLVIGHSFGGKIATLLNPPKLILLSSAGIPVRKSLKVRLKIYIYKIFKILGLAKLRNWFVSDDGKSLSPNMYQTFKNVVDEDFSSIFQKRQGETYIFWGIDDSATPLSSGETLHQLIKNSKFFPMEGDHFFFMGNSSKIEGLIK